MQDRLRKKKFFLCVQWGCNVEIINICLTIPLNAVFTWLGDTV